MTDDDIKKLRVVIKDEISQSEQRLEKKITGTEQRLEGKITGVEQRLEKKITGVEQRLEEKITQVEQKLEKKLEINILESEQRLEAKIGQLSLDIGDFITENVMPEIDKKADKTDIDRIEHKVDRLLDINADHENRIKAIEKLPVVAHELTRKSPKS